jgi:hypothetical protein
MTIHKEFRGITKRLAVRYLEKLGGQAVDDDGDPVTGAGEDLETADRVDRVVADDWTAHLDTVMVPMGPSMQLTEVRIDFEGEDLDDLVETFSQKAMRAGG